MRILRFLRFSRRAFVAGNLSQLSVWSFKNFQFLLLPIPFTEFVLDDLSNGIETRVGPGRLAFFWPDPDQNGGYFKPLSQDDIAKYVRLGWSESQVTKAHLQGLVMTSQAIKELQAQPSFATYRWELCVKKPGFLNASKVPLMVRAIQSRLP